MKVETIVVTPIEQNARLLINENNKQCLVVDPGGDLELILKRIRGLNLEPVAILLTHSHFDHCGAVAGLKEHYDIPLYGRSEGKMLRELVEDVAAGYGLLEAGFKNCPEPDFLLDDAKELEIAGLKFNVSYTPGHSPDHVVFYNEPSQTLIAGDTVFRRSIGRTDLPGGDHQLLINSIYNNIISLPEETVIMPGHGANTTVGEEKAANPFLS